MMIALEVIASPVAAAIRVEGTDDVIDIEVLALTRPPEGPDEFTLIRAVQVKSRATNRAWSPSEILPVFERWESLKAPPEATFEFITDGRLGPSVRKLQSAEFENSWASSSTADSLDDETSVDLGELAPRASIRSDEAPIDVLIRSVEHEVAAMLQGRGTPAQVLVDARIAVDRLFRVVSFAAAQADPHDRLITKDSLKEVIGGDTLIAAADHWYRGLRDEYAEAIRTLPNLGLVVPSLAKPETSEMTRGSSIEPADLLDEARPWMIAGPTGTGKSSAICQVRLSGVLVGREVIICPAELYVAGTFDRLVADSVSLIVGRPLARQVGQHVLNDPAALVVVDGVSELPQELRRELASEIASVARRESQARVGLAGRDEGLLRAALPRGISVATFFVAPFDYNKRRDLARHLSSQYATTAGEDDPDPDLTCAQIEHTLGDAASVPILFKMAYQLVRSGVSYRNRIDLFEGTLNLLAEAERGSAPDVARAVLGVVFSHLLDEGRRYASPLEWAKYEHDAIRIVADEYFGGNQGRVRDDYKISGLVNSIFMGQARSALQVPIHDSLADFLAADALAKGLATLPNELSAKDSQRIEFLAEMRGVSIDLARTLATQLPFVLARVSKCASPVLDETHLATAAELVATVAPWFEHVGILAWEAEGWTVFQLTDGDSAWLECPPEHAFESVAISMRGQPQLTATVSTVWALALQRELRRESGPAPATPQSIEDAVRVLADHYDDRREALKVLVSRLIPTAARESLLDQIGPLGISAKVRSSDRPGDSWYAWDVAYRSGDRIEVAAASGPLDDWRSTSRSSVAALTRDGPRRDAAAAVASALAALTFKEWIAT